MRTPSVASGRGSRWARVALGASLLYGALGCLQTEDPPGASREAEASFPAREAAPDVHNDGGLWEPDAGGPCEPVLDVPRDALEGEPLQIAVRCGTGRALPGEAFVFDALPDGAVYDPAARTVVWTPGLDQAGMRVFGVDVARRERAVAELAIADRWDDPDNVPVDPFEYTEEYGLPVIHLGVSPDIDAKEHAPATLVYGGREYTGVQAKYRGKTSLQYPKKSFTIKLAKNDRLSDQPRGLIDERRIVLTTTFDDTSYLRQRLAYELWNRLSPTHIRVAVFSAVVYLDGEYLGLYLVSDHVDDDLMADHGLWRDGNLYKARGHQANFRLAENDGAAKKSLHDGYTKEEGEPPDGEKGAYDDLDALVHFIATAPADVFYNQLDQRIVRAEFENWWIFVSLIEARDSAGKNSYLYHDPRPDSLQPRWRYVPWDFNASFGQSYRTWRVAPTSGLGSLTTVNGLFERMLAEPRIRGPLFARYRAALDDQYALDTILGLVDEWVAEIDRSALRDEQKWLDEQRAYDWGSEEFPTYSEEVEYLRTWIRERWSVVGDLL